MRYVLDTFRGCLKHRQAVVQINGRIERCFTSPRGGPQDHGRAKEPAAVRRRTKRGDDMAIGWGREGTPRKGDGTRTAGGRGGRRGGIGRTGDRDERAGGTRSPPVHTLVVTPTGKVLAFVKVYRRLSGSSAPRARRRRRRRSVPEPAGFSPRREATARREAVDVLALLQVSARRRKAHARIRGR